MQFIVYATSPASEAAPPNPKMMAELGQLTTESLQAGVLVTTGAVAGTGTRLRQAAGEVTVTDGPFVEAKELMGGFAVLEVKSLEEAIAWSKRFRQIVGDGESEIVRIYGPNDFPGA